MLALYGSQISCGVQMIGGETYYTSPEQFVKDFNLRRMGTFRLTQYVFSHCTKTTKIGNQIEEFIKANNLGVITRSEAANNPVHGSKENPHPIVVWVWTITPEGEKNLKEFCSPPKKEEVKEEKNAVS